VPDKRYTFDILRRTSSDSDLVDAYVRGLRRPDARQIFDHFINFRNVDGETLRSGNVRPGDKPAQHDARDLMEICRRAQGSGEYIDAHCWVFTPRSFVEALDLGSRLDVLPFEIGTIIPGSSTVQMDLGRRVILRTVHPAEFRDKLGPRAHAVGPKPRRPSIPGDP